MMRVEVECYKQIRRSSVLVNSLTIHVGDIKKIDFLEPIRILVFGAVDNKSGKVIIAGKDRSINVFRYEGEEDGDGKEMDVTHPIAISGDQELSIFRKRGKVTKEVNIFIDSSEDDGNNESNPDDHVYRVAKVLVAKK